MTRRLIAWAFFFISLGVIAFVACGTDANAPDPCPSIRYPCHE